MSDKQPTCKILIYKVGEDPTLAVVPNELGSYQGIVGGLIEFVTLWEEDNIHVSVIVNEEGKINGMKPNRAWPVDGEVVDVFFGDFLVIGADQNTGECVSLTDKQIDKVLSFFERARV